MMKLKLFCLVFLILTAFFIRFYKVTDSPPSLNWDEVSIGYNAYSILKTGRDEWSEFLPLHFKSYGEYKLPVQIYFSIPAIAIFGLNDFGVRITPVIYGTLTVVLLFLLAREMFKSFYTGIITALFLAISPWHVLLTRASFESSFAVFWVVFGVYLFIKGLTKHIFLLWSAIPFVLAAYTYNSARVFVPIFLLSIFLFYRKQLFKARKFTLLAGLIFTLLTLPILLFFISGEGNARYKLVSITDDPGLILRINENRGKSSLPYPFNRLVYNKVTYVGFSIINNYTAHFTPQFLFISGAPHKQHHVQNMGMLYLLQAPFLIAGFIYLLSKKHFFTLLLLSWLFISFVPVSVTNDSIPHGLRTLIAVPVYQLISAYGLVKLSKFLSAFKIKFALGVLGIFLLVGQFIWFSYNIFYIYPQNFSRDWQYGNKKAVEFIKGHQYEYDEIVYTRHFGEPHMFTLFYLNYDPRTFQEDKNLIRFETFDWVRVLNFGKYYFPDLGDKGTRFEDIIRENPDKKYLFIGKSGDFPLEQTRLMTINFLNGDRAIEIVEKK